VYKEHQDLQVQPERLDSKEPKEVKDSKELKVVVETQVLQEL
jgi:hypothetical protein